MSFGLGRVGSAATFSNLLLGHKATLMLTGFYQIRDAPDHPGASQAAKPWLVELGFSPES